MCFKKKNFIEKDQIIDAIITLEREEMYIETQIKSLSTEMKLMIECGEELKDNYDKVFLAKKIMILNEEKIRAIKRAMLLLYNLKLAKRLRDVMEENDLVKFMTNLSYYDCLKDQKELAIYLNNALQTKTRVEDILTDADDAFVEVEKMFLENDKIYQITELSEDKLLAMFESNKESEKKEEILLKNASEK